MPDDDEGVLEAMEVDLEVADIEELLQRHGVRRPSVALVYALWEWKEDLMPARLPVGEEPE